MTEDRFKQEKLATLRDTLVPRLISGQLRLPDIAVMVTKTLTGT